MTIKSCFSLVQEAKQKIKSINFKNAMKLHNEGETIFIDLLESIHPDDAKLFLSAKDKNLKLKYVTKAMVKTAFPNLIKK